MLGDYVNHWTWPKLVKFDASTSGHFEKDRTKSNTKAQCFKCFASEGLSFLHVLTYFVYAVVRHIPGVNRHACDVMLALGDLVEALMAIPLGLTTRDRLRSCVRTLLCMCESVGWRDHLIPKLHWLIHLWRELKQFGCLPTCWVHERKHKMVKRYSTDIKHSPVYSQAALADFASDQLEAFRELDLFDLSPGLVKPCKAPPSISNFVCRTLGFLPNTALHTSVSARLSSSN